MNGQLLQEAEKEREGIPASPALSDISVFFALDHRYGWSAAAGGREREGGALASRKSSFSALDHKYNHNYLTGTFVPSETSLYSLLTSISFLLTGGSGLSRTLEIDYFFNFKK